MDHIPTLLFQSGKEMYLVSELRRMRNTLNQPRDQITENTATTVSTRTTKISIKLDGLMEPQANRHAKMSVTPRLYAVVSNGMRADGTDPSAT